MVRGSILGRRVDQVFKVKSVAVLRPHERPKRANKENGNNGDDDEDATAKRVRTEEKEPEAAVAEDDNDEVAEAINLLRPRLLAMPAPDREFTLRALRSNRNVAIGPVPPGAAAGAAADP